jgi:hypothetical protein
MILIAHRGNTDGPDPLNENSLKKISLALSAGYNVEVDVWSIDGSYFLGHDQPAYPVSEQESLLLKDRRVWCHAKNLEALDRLLLSGCHCFWHQEDDRTLTSRNIVWTYPGKEVTKNSVTVTNEREITFEEYKRLSFACLGICSDYVDSLRRMK